jgi:hypothetical protein
MQMEILTLQQELPEVVINWLAITDNQVLTLVFLEVKIMEISLAHAPILLVLSPLALIISVSL